MSQVTTEGLALFAAGPFTPLSNISTMRVGLFQDTQGAAPDANLSLSNLTFCTFDGSDEQAPSVQIIQQQGLAQNLTFNNLTFACNGSANLPQSANGWYMRANNGIFDLLLQFGLLNGGNFTFAGPGDSITLGLSDVVEQVP